MTATVNRLRISLIIPTYNRAALLQQALESLVDQSIEQNEYELVVVDDGSSDETPEVCQTAADKLPLLFSHRPRWRPAARNLGLFASLAPIVFFFNDDELATRNLLQHHLEGHWKYPEENSAILGYTTWAPGLPVSEVMRYILDNDRSYGQTLKDDQQVKFQAFYIGRTSCKRSLLVRRGLFQQDPEMAIHADSELAYRMGWPNVFFRRNAVQYRNRPVTFEELCRRSVRQGRAQWAIRRLHSPMIVRTFWQDWEVNAAQPDGTGVLRFLQDHLRRIREIEVILGKPGEAQKRPALFMELRQLYDWMTFFFRLKGVMEAMNSELDSGPGREEAPPESDLAAPRPPLPSRGMTPSTWPIIIGGCHRSGTSLVRRLLNAHLRIFCGPEVKFFQDFYGSPLSRDPFPHLRFMKSARSLISEDELLDILGSAFISMHERAASHAGKARWADKNPENVLYLGSWDRLLAKRFLFIHVVRHPLDTLASIKEANFPFAVPRDLKNRVAFYRRYTERGLDFERACPDRYCQVRYEQLVRGPEPVLVELMSRLGEPFEPTQLAFNEVAQGSGLEDPKIAQTSIIHAGSVGRGAMC